MPAEKQYIDYQPSIMPGFMQAPNYQNWARAFGYQKDWFVEYALVGVRSRFIHEAPTDALAYHGDERTLPRYLGDTDEEYASRLQDAWNIWTYGGTAHGITLNLQFAGFNHGYCYENVWWQWGSIFPDAEWWHFWVVIDDTVDHVFGDISFHWDDAIFDWDDGKLWDFTINPLNSLQIPNIIHTWKPAHTICNGIYVLVAGFMWDHLWNWDDATAYWDDAGVAKIG